MRLAPVHLHSLDDTARLAEMLATQVRGGDTVALIGGLGAGKTTFTRLFVRALGGPTEVTSPTYVLEHEYPIEGKFTIRHWDVYRLGGIPPELLEPLRGDEVRLIEWADKFPELLDRSELAIRFEMIDSNHRTALITGVRAAQS
jgi:tRNA threonylcarbamoyladenosine biosynthesis protein TsaE